MKPEELETHGTELENRLNSLADLVNTLAIKLTHLEDVVVALEKRVWKNFVLKSKE